MIHIQTTPEGYTYIELDNSILLETDPATTFADFLQQWKEEYNIVKAKGVVENGEIVLYGLDTLDRTQRIVWG